MKVSGTEELDENFHAVRQSISISIKLSTPNETDLSMAVMPKNSTEMWKDWEPMPPWSPKLD